MIDQQLHDALQSLKHQYRTDLRKPFPYQDARKLIAANPEKYASLIPDLDQYFSMIVGYTSWGERITTWSIQKLHEVRDILTPSFFSKHQLYEPLQEWVTLENTPDLYSSMCTVEDMRSTLLRVMQHLEDQISNQP